MLDSREPKLLTMTLIVRDRCGSVYLQNPSVRRHWQISFEFEASLVFIASSGLVRVTQCETCL